MGTGTEASVPDSELLLRWQGGDAGAADSLLDRHFPALLRFFNNKAPQAVEDLVQETLLECVRGIERFRGASSFRTFLFGVAHNVLKRHYRRWCRQLPSADLASVSAHDLSPSPSSLLGHAQEQRLLLDALRRIPLDAQIVLELKYWEDMTSVEIAEVLGIPEGTVRRRQLTARDRLHVELERLACSPALAASVSGGFDRWIAQIRRAVPE